MPGMVEQLQFSLRDTQVAVSLGLDTEKGLEVKSVSPGANDLSLAGFYTGMTVLEMFGE